MSSIYFIYFNVVVFLLVFSSTTTTTEDPLLVTNSSSWQPPSTRIPLPPTLSGNNTPRHGHQPSHTDTDVSSGSIAIIAGAVAGGVFLITVLLIALVLWCRSRNKL